MDLKALAERSANSSEVTAFSVSNIDWNYNSLHNKYSDFIFANFLLYLKFALCTNIRAKDISSLSNVCAKITN